MMRPATVRDLDELTYVEKIRHWNTEDPWHPPEGRYKFSNPKFEQFPLVMKDGNITKMPLLVGRPCFGILTAHLRFRNTMKYVKGMGMKPASRCGTCKVFKQCGKVVDRRIQSNADLRAAHNEWLLANGPMEIGRTGWRDSRSGRRWRDMYGAALRNPFTSSNDDAIRDSYAEQDQRRLVEDRERKRRERKKAQRTGDIDDQHIEDIETAMRRRASRLVEAIREARKTDSPRELSRLTGQSVRELLDVWVGREILRARKQRVTNAAIARWIVEENRSNRSANTDALATRVSKDLRRIEKIEGMPWRNGTLLPRFDPRAEFRD